MSLKKDKLVPQQPLVHHLQAPTKDKGKVVDQLPIVREQNMQIDQEMESTTQHKLPQELEVENPQELVAELPQQTDGHERVTAKKQKRGRTMKEGIHVRGLDDPLKKDKGKVVDQLPIEREQNMQIDRKLSRQHDTSYHKSWTLRILESWWLNYHNRPDGHERVTAKKRKRGRTMKQGIHVRGLEDRDSIIVNPYFQPDMNKFYKGAKERIWEYVKKRWIVPESARKWVLRTVGADWRTFKCKLKKKHYKPYKNNKMRWKNRPFEVSIEHFKWLLKKWDDRKDKDRAKVNALNRAKVTNVRTCGPKSFALIRERLKNANEDKKEPTSVEMFKATRKRVIGRVYKAPIEDTRK
ncbi:hypothetical protein Dimus_013325 [Dionaea muscipula]